MEQKPIKKVSNYKSLVTHAGGKVYYIVMNQTVHDAVLGKLTKNKKYKLNKKAFRTLPKGSFELVDIVNS